jgi:putative ABC transport system substrate-binding protein
MRRREFIALLGGTTAAPMFLPLAAHGQQRMPRIAIFSGFSEPTANQIRVNPFKQQLQTLGWVEGRNIEIGYYQVGDISKLEAAAKELVASKPDLIMVMPTPAMEAIWKATRSIPVVFGNVSDPVEGGFVASMARPDGNVTGFTAFEYSLGGKWLELLKEFAPTTTRVMVLLVQETYTSRGLLRSIEAAGPSLGVKITPAPVRNVGDIERAFETFKGGPSDGLIVLPQPIITNNSKRIFELASTHRIPAVYPFRIFAVNGGLVAYGTVESDVYVRAAGYVDRILKGAKPGELPVQNPIKFELVVNLKTARKMGLTIPSSFLIRADEVIE